MEKSFDNFSYAETVHTVQEAVVSIFCRIIFDWAVHGLAVALFLSVFGLVLVARKNRLSKPFFGVAKKLGIFCAIVAAPGLITLATSGSLPPVGVYNVNSLGFLCLWSLICAHMLGEETNYQWFVKSAPIEAAPVEAAPIESAPIEAVQDSAKNSANNSARELSKELSNE
ncbi:MAG: hypothetical protein WCT03_19440 [Candidatus Obscuribacterales bacterium]|jgi:hypothetical protein